MNRQTQAALAMIAMMLAACAGPPPRENGPSSPTVPGKPGYYKDDGPGENIPADLDSIPDAVPRREPLSRFANRPYTVFGREYIPATTLRPYRERGIASWYGRKFHGQRTSTGEPYDMYGMTAAHPTLPLPSFARVTNVATGKSVVVRVNDRGPFLHGRVIDLSYAAAHKLGIAQKGSGAVEVEAILFDDPLASAAPALPPVGAGDAGAVAPGPGAVVAQGAAGALPPVVSPSAPMDRFPADHPVGPLTVGSRDTIGETIPVAATATGYVVQLGAFASYANARNFVDRLSNQLPAAGVEAQVRQVNGLFRVFVGPYPTRDAAKGVADRLRAQWGLPSTIATH